MPPFDAQRFYDEISRAVTAFFSLDDKESQLVIGDLLACLEEETGVLLTYADTPTTLRYRLAYDNISIVANKLQTDGLLDTLDRLAKSNLPMHTGERKRIINEMLKRFTAVRALYHD